MGVPKEGRIKKGQTVVHVQMIEESGGGAALPDQAAGAGDGGCGGLHAGADGAVEPGLHGGHLLLLLLLLLRVEHHLLLLLLGGHGGRVREVRRGGGMRRRRRRLVPDLVVGQEPGEDVVGAGVGAAGARPGLEEVLADLAEQRARRRSVAQQPGRSHRRLHRQVQILGHRRAIHHLTAPAVSPLPQSPLPTPLPSTNSPRQPTTGSRNTRPTATTASPPWPHPHAQEAATQTPSESTPSTPPNPETKKKKPQNFPADEHSAKSLFALDLSTSLPKLLPPISLCLSLSTAFVRRREEKGRKRRESQQP